MTISNETSSVTYLGNGSTTNFTFSFVGVSLSDIEVVYTNSGGVPTTLDPSTYTLVLNAASPGQLWGIGGTVTYPNVGSPISVGTQISIIRIVPYEQNVSIANQGAFYPQAVEQALDLVDMQIQQVNTEATYSLKTPITDPSPPKNLPAAAERANGFLTFDSLGQPMISSGIVGGGGTVTSAGLVMPPEFSVSGTPITTSGVLTVTKALESSNTVYGGPTTGSPAQPTFRSLVPGDLPVATVGALGAVRPDGTSITISGGVLSAGTAPTGANPSATAGPTAVNGSANTFMRSDGAPAVQVGSSSQKGLLQVDNTTITASSGVISAATATSSNLGIVKPDNSSITVAGGVLSVTGAGFGTVTTTGSPASGNLTKFSGATSVTNGDLSGDVTTSGSFVTTLANTAVTPTTYGDSTHVPQFTVDSKGRLTAASNVSISAGPTAANPTATGGDTAVNGVASTFMRSDAAPAIQLSSSSLFGLSKVDNVTIGASGGVISVIGTPSQVNGTFPYSPTAAASFTNNVNGGAGSISIADVAHVGTVMTWGTMSNTGQIRGYDMAWTPGKTATAFLKTIYLHQFIETFIYFTDGTKVLTFGLNQNGGTYRADIGQWTNSTTFSTTAFTTTSGPPLNTMIRVRDDGTNYNYDVSCDGTNWVNLTSVVRGAFLTATRVGFGGNLQNAITTATGFVTQTYWTLV